MGLHWPPTLYIGPLKQKDGPFISSKIEKQDFRVPYAAELFVLCSVLPKYAGNVAIPLSTCITKCCVKYRKSILSLDTYY